MALNLSGTTGIVTGNIGNSQVTSGKLASGAARANFGAGAVLQVVSTSKTDVFSTTSASFTDITGLSVSITPSSTSNKILVMASGCGGMDSANSAALRLVRDSTSIFVGDTAAGYTSVSFANFYGGSGDGNNSESFSVTYLDSPSSISSLTYKIQAIAAGGTLRINSNGADLSGQPYSYRSASSITVMEIAG
jgi:hypothetical protein